MKRLTLVLFFLFLIFLQDVMGDETLRWERPDGKMLVVLQKEGSGYRLADIHAVPGAQPFSSNSEDTLFRLLDKDANLICEGWTTLPRYSYYDSLADGRLSGETRLDDEKIALILPYYKEAASLVLAEKDGTEFVFSLPAEQFSGGVIADESPALRHSPPPDFAGYIESLQDESIPNRESLPRADPASVSPSQEYHSIALKTTVEGLGPGASLSVIAYFYDNLGIMTGMANGDGDLTAYVLSETCLVQLFVSYTDQTLNNQAVTLYPNPLTVRNIDVGSGELDVSFALNNLLQGVVEDENGKGVKARYWIFDNSRSDGGFFNSIIGRFVPLFTKDDGTFAARLPAKTFTIVAQPLDQTAAGGTLKVVRVSANDNNTVELACPPLDERSGDSLRQIWGKPAGRKGWGTKLNIIFLAEAYTDNNETFTDLNGNGRWDGDLLLDVNVNGRRDYGEYFYDRNENYSYDEPEPFADTNGDKVYNRNERAQFEITSALMTTLLLDYPPFDKKAYSKRINVFTYWIPSRHGVQRFTNVKPWAKMQTALGVSCSGTKSSSACAADEANIYKIAAEALPEFTQVVIMVRDPFNVVASTAKYNFGRVYVSGADKSIGGTLIHEFGHSFASLTDEYLFEYSKDWSWNGPEPESANITIETDPSKVKWKKYITGPIEVPTPFGTEGYGLFEGAGSAGRDLYRPTSTSMMRDAFSPFYKVNEDELIKVLKKFK
jgi:hypothetical protein